MSWYDPDHWLPSSELPPHPRGERVAEIDAFNDLLTGMNELALATGMSGADFVLGSFEEMEKQGLVLDDFHFAAIMRAGFGSAEEALAWMETAEQDKMPEELIDALLLYTDPTIE